MVPIGGLSEYAKSGLPTAVKGIGLGTASRVFTFHLLDRLQSSFNPTY